MVSGRSAAKNVFFATCPDERPRHPGTRKNVRDEFLIQTQKEDKQRKRAPKALHDERTTVLIFFRRPAKSYAAWTFQMGRQIEDSSSSSSDDQDELDDWESIADGGRDIADLPSTSSSASQTRTKVESRSGTAARRKSAP